MREFMKLLEKNLADGMWDESTLVGNIFARSIDSNQSIAEDG